MYITLNMIISIKEAKCKDKTLFTIKLVNVIVKHAPFSLAFYPLA